MRLKPWEIAVTAAGLVFASYFLLSNVSGLGFALLAAVLLWVITRIEILEDHDVPGHYTSIRGKIGVLRLVLLLGIYTVGFYGIYIIQHDFGSKARATVIAEFAIVGLWCMLAAESVRSAKATANWIQGARAEREVGESLLTLGAKGWLVMHGYKRDWGDIDHIVCGPNGVFAIETKSYGYKARDARQAAGNAAWLKERIGVVPWVTAVLCVDGDPEVRKKDTVWVVGHREIVDWLVRQPSKPTDTALVLARLVNSRDHADTPGATFANA